MFERFKRNGDGSTAVQERPTLIGGTAGKRYDRKIDLVGYAI